jgi:hypothetical protein
MPNQQHFIKIFFVSIVNKITQAPFFERWGPHSFSFQGEITLSILKQQLDDVNMQTNASSIKKKD